MKKLLQVLLVTLLAISLFGCSEKNNDPDNGVVKVKVGILQDLTGATSSLGNSCLEGVKDAIKEINEQGKLEISYVEYDTAGDTATAVNMYTTAVTVDNVDLIIGPPIANIVNGIKAATESYDVPVITFAVDPACYTDENGKLYTYLSCIQPSTDVQGKIMADFAYQNGHRNVGVFYTENNSYSVALLKPFVDEFRSLGGTIEEKNIIPYQSTETDIKTLIKPLVDAGLDAIYCPNYTQPLVLIAQTCVDLEYKGKIINGLDAAPAFNSQAGIDDLSFVYYINNIDIYDEVTAAKAAKASDKVGAINKYFLGYDAMTMAAKCIEEVGLDGKTLANAIVNVKNFDGLTGTLTMDPKTHMPALETPMFMYTYEGTTPVMLQKYPKD